MSQSLSAMCLSAGTACRLLLILATYRCFAVKVVYYIVNYTPNTVISLWHYAFHASSISTIFRKKTPLKPNPRTRRRLALETKLQGSTEREKKVENSGETVYNCSAWTEQL